MTSLTIPGIDSEESLGTLALQGSPAPIHTEPSGTAVRRGFATGSTLVPRLRDVMTVRFASVVTIAPVAAGRSGARVREAVQRVLVGMAASPITAVYKGRGVTVVRV